MMSDAEHLFFMPVYLCLRVLENMNSDLLPILNLDYLWVYLFIYLILCQTDLQIFCICDAFAILLMLLAVVPWTPLVCQLLPYFILVSETQVELEIVDRGCLY